MPFLHLKCAKWNTPAEIMDSQILESIYSVPMGVMERAPGQWVSYVH